MNVLSACDPCWCSDSNPLCHLASRDTTHDSTSLLSHGLIERYCRDNDLNVTRSRSGNKNEGAHVEQKNWTTVRQLVGYVRYDAEAELLLLNKIWEQQALIGNHFYPQQKSAEQRRSPLSRPYKPLPLTDDESLTYTNNLTRVACPEPAAASATAAIWTMMVVHS